MRRGSVNAEMLRAYGVKLKEALAPSPAEALARANAPEVKMRGLSAALG